MAFAAISAWIVSASAVSRASCRSIRAISLRAARASPPFGVAAVGRLGGPTVGARTGTGAGRRPRGVPREHAVPQLEVLLDAAGQVTDPAVAEQGHLPVA